MKNSNSNNGFILLGACSSKFKNEYLNFITKNIPSFLSNEKTFKLSSEDELHLSLAIGRISEGFGGNVEKKKSTIVEGTKKHLETIKDTMNSIVMFPKDIRITDGGYVILELNVPSSKDNRKMFDLTKGVIDTFSENKLNLPQYMQNYNHISQFLPHISIGRIGADKFGKADASIVKNAQSSLDNWKLNNSKNYKEFLGNIIPYSLYQLEFKDGDEKILDYKLEQRNYNVKDIKFWPKQNDYSVYFDKKDQKKAEKFCHYLRLFNNMNQNLKVSDSKSDPKRVVVHIAKQDYEGKYKHRVRNLI